MKRASIFTAAALAAALLGVSATAAPAGTSKPAGLPHVQHLTLTVVGAGMNQRILPSTGNIAIAAGVPVRVTIVNHSREYHTFTIPGLHVSALVLPAQGQTPTKTTFTFTASKQGVFKWHCTFCASGAHSRPHEMGGTVYAIIDPLVLP